MPHEQGGKWVSRWWRPLVAEVVATALLVVLGVGSLLPAPVPLTHPALGFGFVVTALVCAFGPISGAHMNPAVTLAALIHRQIAPLPAAAYVLAQFVGAFIGFGMLSLLAPMEKCAGCTLPAGGDTVAAAMAAAAVEALLTGVLALVCGALWTGPQPDHTAPIKLGLTVAGLVYAGGKLSGASLNPARSVAPAALRGCWTGHWAYWLGPLGGAALCSLLHRALLPPAVAPGPAPVAEELPLRDKQDV